MRGRVARLPPVGLAAASTARYRRLIAAPFALGAVSWRDDPSPFGAPSSWCSDGFELPRWNRDVVRGAFVIGALDREIVFRRPVVNAGIGGSDVRDMMPEAVQRRFAACKTPNPVEMLTGNGAPDSARDTRILGRQIGPKTPLHAGEEPAEHRDIRGIRDAAKAQLPSHHAAARRSDRPRTDRRVVRRRQPPEAEDALTPRVHRGSNRNRPSVR